MEMMLEYDPTADAAYVELSGRPVDRTDELDQDRMVDYDADGRVVGYEFLNVSRGVELRDLPHRDELAGLFEGRNIRVLV
jgi:YD repeat-containing protein